MTPITPENIIILGFAYWGSKTLLSAVELGVFSALAKSPADLPTLQKKLGLHERSARDFLDALVALKVLDRDDGVYRNTPDADLFLDKAKPSYVGGLLEMSNSRLYGFWGSLTEALKTGKLQNEAKDAKGDLFESLYADPERLSAFLKAMSGGSEGAAHAIAAKFPWKEYNSFADIGAAQVTLARTHPHLSGIGFDLPQVRPIFDLFCQSTACQDVYGSKQVISSKIIFHRST